ncbi:MAG: hypothetical protein ABR920_02860 [Terriglobales bacterium]
MKKAMLLVLFVVMAASLALAAIPPIGQYTTDTLGAHLGYGRGCIMCHAPHSGPAGNNALGVATSTGEVALWGQNLTPLYGDVINFGDGAKFPVTLPANQAAVTAAGFHDPTVVILFCLSCHDGNLAKVAMMHGKTVETLPIVGGNAPTLLGNDGSTAGNYNNDHPVGVSAQVGCGGLAAYQWDCTITAGKVIMNGPNSSVFANTNYGFGVKLANVGGVPTVTCTTCHNQHNEYVFSGTMGGTPGNYKTAFFLNGYYDPSTGGNNAAQFCRQCHGVPSNEMAGQLSVPTT